MSNEELIRLALEAREMAYTPYSHWKVGAALLTKSGKVYKGCNIENSGFSATICAERTAIFKAVSEGEYDFEKIAIISGDEVRGPEGYCTPCGVCRQVMTEFCKPDEFVVVCARSVDDYQEFTLRQMIPECNYIVDDDGYGLKG